MTKLYNFIYTEPMITINIPYVTEQEHKQKQKQKQTFYSNKKQKYTSKQRRRYHNIKQPGFDVQRRY